MMRNPLEIPQERGFCLEHLIYKVYTDDPSYLAFKINPDLKPYLIELSNNFTSYIFENITQLNSQYSIRIYELLKQFENNNGGWWKKTIEELREILRIEPKQYPKYANFKQKVILQAQKELEEKTDIKFTFEEHKTGRKVEMITFHIAKNKKNIIEKKAEEIKEPVKSDKLLELEGKEVYKILTIELKISEFQILEYLEKYTIQRIENNANYTFEKLKAGEIRSSVSGYLKDSIEKDRASSVGGDFSSKEYQEQKRKEQEEKERAEREQKAYTEELEREYNSLRKAKINEFLQDKEQVELREELLTEFRIGLKTKTLSFSLSKLKGEDLETNANIKKRLNTDHLFMVHFRTYIAPRVLPKELMSFEDYQESINTPIL
jgi:hypothetical protein